MSRINKSKIISEKLKYLSITELPKHITVESIDVDIDTITNKETGEEEIDSYMVVVKLKTFCEPEIPSVSARMAQTNNYILSFLKKYKLDVNFKFNSNSDVDIYGGLVVGMLYDIEDESLKINLEFTGQFNN
jgi:CRISPR/Cas system-associated exonuclease Cas4 (RecB family)